MRLLVQSRRDREADITIPPAVFLLLQSAVHGRAPNVSAIRIRRGCCHDLPERQSRTAAKDLLLSFFTGTF